jgi:DNA-binding GntR family transcriptional regulator
MPVAPADEPRSPASVAPERRYELIERVLRDNIASGRLAPGTVLLEAPIAELLQTSRAPVSTALQGLLSAGLVHPFDGRGYLVGPPGRPLTPQRVDLRRLGLEVSQTLESALQSRGSLDRIYTEMEDAIASCLAFGEFRIAEIDVAEHFNVSRTVAREALSKLLERGLVRKTPSSRWAAGPLTARSIRDTFELRRALEPVALAAAMNHWPREALLDVQALIRSAHADGEPDSDAIEDRLIAATLLHSPNLKMRELIQHNLVPLRAMNKVLNQLGLPSDHLAIKECDLIVDLLLKDSIDAAAALWRDHLLAAERRSVARLKLVGVLPTPASVAPFLARV